MARRFHPTASVLMCLFGLVTHLLAQAPAPQAKLLEKENVVEASKPAGRWLPAQIGMPLAVRDRVRTGELSRSAIQLTDLSILRMDELTTLEIQPPQGGANKATLDIKSGGMYFFSRESAEAIQIKTPAATGALRGTQLIVRVSGGGKTLVRLLEGELTLSNPLGTVDLRSGEQAEAEIGKAPRKTAVIEAVNLLQWALYYPAVLDPSEIGMSASDQRAVAGSLGAYRSGDLLGALERYPKGYSPSSTGGRLYRAGVVLAVGQVDEAQRLIAGVPANHPGRVALERMIAGVRFEEQSSPGEPATASGWIAESYYQQSRSNLEAALDAAKRACELAPEFGYADVRLAELHFSFGRTPQAHNALERGLHTTPNNAQGHALRGFLLSAQNRIEPARDAFNHAIELDGALGNAWLGRGLTYIRQGKDEQGRQDLHTAATLEPNRSILNSYLGKAFSQVGDSKSANKDFKRAIELDPNDPTPWLYSAIEMKQENRYNEAVADLERSLVLNDNRRVYRSRFLLDQDRGVRSSNLAAIYQNAGMVDVAVREATRAVDADYGSAGAHLFLANAFNSLRDPSRILLRYETQWFNELLLANLLSPVGGGPLSQYVSQAEYSKLFEANRLGISSITDYFSNGELRETASQFGVYNNFSYALDVEYQYFNGTRPNNELSRFEGYATFKFQLTPQDTIFLQTKYQDLQTGDVFQRFDQDEVDRKVVVGVDNNGKPIYRQNRAAQTFDFTEKQEPGLLLAGFHHEWSPGNHTVVLLGRLANGQDLTADETDQLIFTRDATDRLPANLDTRKPIDPSQPLSNRELREELEKVRGKGPVQAVSGLDFDSYYRSSFEIYSAEVNQILTLGPQTVVFGTRYQTGDFDTQHTFRGNNQDLRPLFTDPPSNQDATGDFERITAYLYDFWRVTPWLSLIGGISYDYLSQPENYRNPPLSNDQDTENQVSPKVGFTLNLPTNLILRGAYTRSLSGVSFDESIRLEPTQIAGFSQVSRTYISESVVGSVAGASFQTYGISLEQKLPTRTYWGLQFSVVEQDLDRTVGVFDFLNNTDNLSLRGVLPSSTREKLSYREDTFSATLNQLVGNEWSFGARYQYSKARLRDIFRDVSTDVFPGGDQTRTAHLQQVNLYALYNHRCGFFARGEANWFSQDNDGFSPGTFSANPQGDPRPGDDFWMFNVYAGYRFYRNQCEVAIGVLNLGDNDYQLEPLNYYLDMPRERTFFARMKFSF
jgi:tetratricopeptide (TPR) repeat protein